MKKHFVLMAAYNGWANGRLYKAADGLGEEALWRDLGAFFGSLMGTLNHILVADRLWLARFRGEPPPSLALDSVLFRDLAGLAAARAAEDRAIAAHVATLTEERLGGVLSYRTSAGVPSTTPFAATLSHVFNHQTHHRGQAHVLLGQLGLAPPPLDLIYYLREVGG